MGLKAIGDMPGIVLGLTRKQGFPEFFIAAVILGGKTVSNWLQPLYLYLSEQSESVFNLIPISTDVSEVVAPQPPHPTQAWS